MEKKEKNEWIEEKNGGPLTNLCRRKKNNRQEEEWRHRDRTRVGDGSFPFWAIHYGMRIMECIFVLFRLSRGY
jgi:hypothetical protein